MRRIPLFTLLAATLCAPCWAWGSKGHSWATENAIQLLPDPALRAWAEERFGELLRCSLAPDYQLRDGLDAPLESPNHFLNFEALVPSGQWEDLPACRVDALARCTELGLPPGGGGMLPYRIEELYAALVNAFRCDPRNAALCAGLLAHYAADATQPLHVTVDYDGRAGQVEAGRKYLQGIHAEFEIVFVEDSAIEFRLRSRQAAAPVTAVPDVRAATIDVLRASLACVDPIYAAAEAHQGEGKYAAWDREIGDLTAGRLGAAASFTASLWHGAWRAAGSPPLPTK